MVCSTEDMLGLEKQRRVFDIADWYKYTWMVALIIASQLSFVSGLNRCGHRSPHSRTRLLDTTRHRRRQHLKPFTSSPLSVAFPHMAALKWAQSTADLHNLSFRNIPSYLCVTGGNVVRHAGCSQKDRSFLHCLLCLKVR